MEGRLKKIRLSVEFDLDEEVYARHYEVEDAESEAITDARAAIHNGLNGLVGFGPVRVGVPR
jgi:hypothetical protein